MKPAEYACTNPECNHVDTYWVEQGVDFPKEVTCNTCGSVAVRKWSGSGLGTNVKAGKCGNGKVGY